MAHLTVVRAEQIDLRQASDKSTAVFKMDLDYSIWFALIALGAFHGINPGMGWLFAVALGLQEESTTAVWRSLLPLANGHAFAIIVTVLVGVLAGQVLPPSLLKWIVALVLFGFGVWKLIRNRHPRYGGMRVNGRDLTIWSFLMACAHGAGLMVLPCLLGSAPEMSGIPSEPHTSMPTEMVELRSHDRGVHDHVANDQGSHDQGAGHHSGHGIGRTVGLAAGGHEHHGATVLENLPKNPGTGLMVALLHTLGYLLATGAAALVVYKKIGLRLLRTAWFNLDLVWAASLILTSALTLLL